MSDNLQKSKQNLKKALERLEKAVEGGIKLLKMLKDDSNKSSEGNSALDLSLNSESEDTRASQFEDLQSLSLSLQDLKKPINN